MKRILILLILLSATLNAIAQTDGITYQAVIIGPDDLELPGVDSQGNYLPNATIAVRFTIFDQNNGIEFQEVQITDTDEFGRINLLIGDANHDEFKEISWDGTPKDLRVEIDFNAGNSFEIMSRERLTFLPYAYHRNITATGTLTVDDRTFLNGELQVEGPTNLNSSLDVNNGNATNLSGTLNVDSQADFNAIFNVNNGSPSNLSGDVTVGGNSLLNGTLDVIGMTTLNDLTVNGEASFGDLVAENLLVNQSTTLNGVTRIDGMGNQIHLTSNFPNVGTTIGNHPVLIDGGRNGLAIKVNDGRSNNTNFITFYDDLSNAPWGRIEGETDTEFDNNADYRFDQASLGYDIFDAYSDYAFAVIDGIIAGGALGAALADVRPCAGLGACIVSPGPSMIAAAVAQVAIEAGKIVTSSIAIGNAEAARATYDADKLELQGVTYASGAGDYAEYLLRQNKNEEMSYGDIVGVRGGKVSKNTQGAERSMVISYKPIVLGNMPEADKEANYEKVAFMGQVPVKVFGKVSIGDYIIPSGNNDGIGRAIPRKSVTTEQINQIVGVAWSVNEFSTGFNMVNVAVGLNANDNNPIIQQLEQKVNTQTTEISELKNQLAEVIKRIGQLETGANQNMSSVDSETTKTENYSERKYEILDTPHGAEIIYFELTRDDVLAGITLAEKQMKDKGIDIENHEFWKQLNSNPSYKENFINKLLEEFDAVMHYHKEIDKNAKH